MKSVIRPAAMVMMLILGTGVAHAASTSVPPTATPTAGSPGPVLFNLSAEGEVSLAPDIAVLQMGVSAQAPTAAEAIRLNRERMNSALAALKSAGVAPKDIQTSGFNLGPQYAYEPNKPPRLTGYVASNSVSATVREIGRAGAVIDAVTASGANQINGISFDIADRRKAENDARRAAVRALQDKVELYAAATGLHVVRLASLSEGSDAAPPSPPRVYAVARMSAEAVPTPVEPGETKVRMVVNGIYELDR
jgi:uncharacterized protein